jgi:signal transduction histidine kinase
VIKKITILILLITYSSVLFAEQKTLSINEIKNLYPVKEYLYIYKDTTNTKDINDILHLPENKFIKNTKNKLNFGLTRAGYWFKLNISNQTNEYLQLFLIVKNPDLNHLHLYKINNSRICKTVKTGELKPFKTRDIYHKDFIFNISIKPDEKHTYYLYACNNGDANFIPLKLERKEYFRANNYDYLFLNGIILGVFIFCLIFVLCLLIIIKNRLFISFFLFGFFLSLFLGLREGFVYQYILPNHPGWSNKIILASLALGYFFLIIFTKRFFNIYKKNSPLILPYILNSNLILSFIIVMLSLTNYPWLLGSVIGLYIMTPVALLSITVLIVFYLGNKIKIDRKLGNFYSVAFIILVGSSIFYVLRDLGYLKYSLITQNSIKIGFVSFYILILLALIDYFRREQLDINRQLSHARNKAEDADRLKTAFLANMSHEIRTPMNAIIGFSELLSRKKLTNDKLAIYTEIIKNRSNDLLHIIHNIVDISKIETGQINVNYEEIDLVHLFEELYTTFKLKLRKMDKNEKVTLKLNYEGSLRNIETDPYLMKGIIFNLLDNALKFTSEGTIEFGFVKAGENIKIFISDTGCGIPEEFHDIIFDRFRQRENYMSKQYGGNGLGLAISKNYASLLNGSIHLNSEPGKGSTFYFIMPILGNNNTNNYD